MRKIRSVVIMMSILMSMATSAVAQASIGIGLPNLSIGINLPMLPELIPVPGYPVYYAPRVDANYFFYDGMYWVYRNDNWYASSWYNGPWAIVQPEAVPLFVLRVPVSFYRQPPAYFRGWQSNAAPRWGQHWGHDWQQSRKGWDKWKRGSAPALAPLPVYQRQYTGDRYPQIEQQRSLRSQQYRYQARDKVIRQHINQQVEQKTPPPPPPPQQGRRQEPAMKIQKPQDAPHSAPLQQGAPADAHSQPPQRGGELAQKPVPNHTPPPQRGPAAHEQKQQPPPVPREQKPQPPPVPREQKQQPPPAAHEQRQQPAPHEQRQQAPRLKEQDQKMPDREESQEPNRGRGQGQKNDDERGQGRNR